ncbi:murein DD-endopeptidase MepM/ murein hydrolase activator NlpD [Desulfobaculum xiamenense]|uniref:Murein DD-endopeptidase MepM/ murein hydrolase activator NlpD n=1 Tax=Desulfobaculum xiamenense TaxID=995050 RepID=A0A846QV82_9BACT|nr:M23 family metallopeptidase [Desulfobaculum xiamenense]NJB69024.1 murein DD-endopeptidase MepM/ murein hydrolase activator NlpD [Desulfobaculum xiamenense]
MPKTIGASLVRTAVSGFLVLMGYSACPHAAAYGFTLEIPPVDCARTGCVIQNYVDQDPSPDYRDYACGRLSYDGSSGTDFRLPNLADMQRGVEVYASAPGTVRAVRDGMADVNFRDIGIEALKGRYAGNSVVIDHGDGWETQYSHLRRDSVRVQPGQTVRTGEVLGLVGMSGLTEFPHVEIAVRHHGDIVDPFTGHTHHTQCDATRNPLWSQQALDHLRYIPTGLLGAAFTASVPTAGTVRDGGHRAETLPPSAPAIVFWCDMFGLLDGDMVEVRLTGPDGKLLARGTRAIDHSKAQYFLYVGKRRKAAPWKPGDYTGTCRVSRKDTGGTRVALDIVRTLVVR